MGAFFLYKKDTPLQHDEARKVFNRKGFSPPERLYLGDWVLWLYRKQVVEAPNYYTGEDRAAVFCCGTVVYRCLGYKESLKRLAQDFSENQLDLDELLGNFCLLFWDGKMLSMLTDRLNVQHVFINDQKTCLSSSFLALLASSPYPLNLNRLAALEKLSTGYIVSPDTLVEGIQQVNADLQTSFAQKDGLRFIRYQSRQIAREFHKCTFSDSIQRQLHLLRDYFKSIDHLHCEFSGELGLSGGYDCRLILALSRQLTRPLGLHTHHTLGVHEGERRVAEKLAEINGNRIISIPTRCMEEQEENRLGDIIRDSLYFFDGRCAYSVGAFSETYTSWYRKETLKENRLSLNGLGGEIFRNSYFTPQGRFSWQAWMDRNVFYPFSSEVVGSPEIFKRLKKHIHHKIENLLQSSIPNKVDLHMAHTYYGLVRMPECAGIVNNAYGQVSFFLTPFIEYPIIQEALKATSHIGCDGRYQAGMIRQTAPDLADVMSHYGFPFSKIPALYILKSKIRSMLPIPLMHERARLLLLRQGKRNGFKTFKTFLVQSKTMQEIEGSLKDFFPQSDWPKAFLHYAQRRASIFVGFFFKEFSGKIRT